MKKATCGDLDVKTFPSNYIKTFYFAVEWERMLRDTQSQWTNWEDVESNQVIPKWLWEKASAFSSLNCKASWRQMGEASLYRKRNRQNAQSDTFFSRSSAWNTRCLKSLPLTPETWPAQPRTRTAKTLEKGSKRCPCCHPGFPPFSSVNTPVGATSMDKDQQTQSMYLLLQNWILYIYHESS